jgi:hypothetical protein
MLSAAGGPAAGVGITPLIERCWPAITKVAAQLFRDGEVMHEDVCEALRIPPRDNGHHLALIRSGQAPGTFTVTRAAGWGRARPYGGWGLLAHVNVGCRRESGPGR